MKTKAMSLVVLGLLTVITDSARGADPPEPAQVQTASKEAPAGIFVAVGYGGRRMSSRDGIHWENVQQWVNKAEDDSNNLISLAYGKGKFVAVGGGGWSRDTQAGHILVSSDGAHSRETKKMAFRISPILFTAGKFVAGGPEHQLLWSDDAETWSESPKVEVPKGIPGWAFWFRGGIAGDGTFIFTGNANTDQKTWWCITTHDGKTIDSFASNLPPVNSLAFGAGTFLLVSGSAIYTTKDGKVWHKELACPYGQIPPSRLYGQRVLPLWREVYLHVRRRHFLEGLGQANSLRGELVERLALYRHRLARESLDLQRWAELDPRRCTPAGTGHQSDRPRRGAWRYVAMKKNAISLVVLGLLAVIFASAGGAEPPKPAQTQPAIAPNAVFFQRDVMPLVTRLGCNSVQCHGAPLGKGGMPLAMFGGDAEEDYETIVKDQRGTRINRMDPARSLLLLKVSGGISHGGAAENPARLRGLQDAARLDRARSALQRREVAQIGLCAGPSARAGAAKRADAATCSHGGLCRRYEAGRYAVGRFPIHGCQGGLG